MCAGGRGGRHQLLRWGTRNRAQVRPPIRPKLLMTPQRRAERTIGGDERFQRYFELGLIGMVITSPTKGFLEVNDQVCEILGYERDELLRMSWAELTHPGDLAADVVNFNRVVAGECDGYSMDKRFIRKDGAIID